MFPGLQFLRGEVDNVMAGISQQQSLASNLLDTLKGYVPKVQASWIGGDADEFAQDVTRKLVPAMVELIAAIGGINLNLTKATSTLDNADKKAKGLADQLGDLFAQI